MKILGIVGGAGVFLLFPLSVHAADPMCRPRASIHGSKCEDLTVTIKLNGCGDEKIQTNPAELIECSERAAVASALSETYLYRSELVRGSDGAWKVKGRIQRSPRSDVKGAETASAPEVETPIAGSDSATWRVSGFIDAQYQENLTTSDSNGFVVQDGAVYVSRSMGSTEARIDLPFQMTNTSGNSDFTIGRTKAQAYFERQLGSGWSVKVGQFDRFYGVEANDTVDNFFGRQGLLYAANPFVHTGVVANWRLGSVVSANFLVANPHDTGSARGENLEYGMRWAADGIVRLSAMGLMSRLKGTGLFSKYYDFVAGTTLGVFSLDLEGSLKQPTGVGDYEKRYLALLILRFSPVFAFGARGEHADLPTSKDNRVFVGPEFTLDESNRIRAGYTRDHQNPIDPASTASVESGVDVSWVYRL